MAPQIDTRLKQLPPQLDSTILASYALFADTLPLVRIHSECLLGDALYSTLCHCREELHQAFRHIADAGCGIIVYLRQEGRGIGLMNKITALTLMGHGANPGTVPVDTFTACTMLGLPPDRRRFDVAAAVLHSLGVRQVCLLGQNPAKRADLEAQGINVREMRPFTSELPLSSLPEFISKVIDGHQVHQDALDQAYRYIQQLIEGLIAPPPALFLALPVYISKLEHLTDPPASHIPLYTAIASLAGRSR